MIAAVRRICTIAAVAIAPVLLPGAALAIAKLEVVDYVCERGATVTAVYVSSDGAPQVVLMAEGNVVTLTAVPVASGTKYRGDPTVQGYLWWTEAGRAMLGWLNPVTNDETALFSDCRELPR